MPQQITATKLYDYTQCPHRVWRDIYGPEEEKIQETNPFVKLLWERGIAHEENVVSQLGEFINLRLGTLDERFKQTIKAMREEIQLIYQGVLQYENMLGVPDLLELLPDGQYVPIEIKSGSGYEGVSEERGEKGKLKKQYAVQLALYVELLNKLGFENKRLGKVIDIHANKVDYELNLPIGKRDQHTLWEFYKETKSNVSQLINNEVQNKPALAGVCKLCHWYLSCKKWVEHEDDLTRIYYLGRSKRDVINEDLGILKAEDFLTIDTKEVLKQKKRDKSFLKGIAEKSLYKILNRAEILLNTKQPVVYTNIEFPKVRFELYFDIEDDPIQEFVYMHGVYVKGPDGKDYMHFTATEMNEEAEKSAWQDFWNYIRSLPINDFAVYYYSHHEKTTYKRLQKLYPDVISVEELGAFFDHPNVIDLFDVVNRHTDWPVSSYSLKDLAQYLGFEWRDETPSGALSIEWFNRFLETRDQEILNRLLAYNEDDCKATMILKEAIEGLVNSKID